MKLYKALKQMLKPSRTLVTSYNVNVKRGRSASVEGADIWGTDWVIPVAEKLDWTLYESRYDNKQYLITMLTDYILWFIPFHYDEYIVELPKGYYDYDNLTHKQVVDMIGKCEKWNQNKELEPIHGNDSAAFIYNDQVINYTLGDNDYDLMRLK